MKAQAVKDRALWRGCDCPECWAAFQAEVGTERAWIVFDERVQSGLASMRAAYDPRERGRA